MENKNRFVALAEEEDEALTTEDINALNGWSVKVNRKSKKHKAEKLPKPDVLESFVIKSEKQLDQLLAKHPHLAAIPDTDKKIRKVLKSMPAQLVCGPDETLCLVDSGSTINAAWIEKHFPWYAKMVKPTTASLRGDSATTAGGHKLINKGRCVVQATANDIPFPVAFKDMETELPILSVRKMVKRNNDVQFRKGGGQIRNRDSGHSVPFYEHEGVYFLKMKVNRPDQMQMLMSPDKGKKAEVFAWPGA